MGCAASKVKKAEDVSRCRARRRLMKQAVASRHQFAAAHAAYIQAMKNVGAAFRQFGETEMRVDSAAGTTTNSNHKSTLQSDPERPLPPPPPPVFLHDDSSPHIEFLSPPASPTKQEQEQDGAADHAAAAGGGDEEHEHEHYEDAKADSIRKDGFYSKKKHEEEEEEDHQSSSTSSVFYYHDREASNKDYYYAAAAAAAPPPPPVPSSTAPPPPSPPRTSAWDFLDPFRPPEPPMHLQEQRRLKKMEQQIHHHQQEQEDQEDEDDDEEDGDDQDEEDHLVRKSNKNHHQQQQQHPSSGTSLKRDLAIIVLPAGGIGRKELVEVVKEVDELFLRAYECGKDVSKLLEARKVHYHSNFVDSKGYESHSKRVLQAISLGNRTSSKSPLKVVASEDHLSSPDEGGTAGSHAATLDKLLAWEKKLYEEVKTTEKIRAEFRKKCSSVKSVDLKEEVSETTKALIKTLSTKVQVSLQGVDTAITAINKLKEDELFSQLVQLIEGLMNMWSELYDCHHRQHRIVAEMKAVDHWGSVEPTTNIHRVATSQLELALQAWFLSFNKLLAAHRDYLHNLTGWLRLSNMELEMEAACRESGSSQTVTLSKFKQDHDQEHQQRVNSKSSSGKLKSSSSSSSSRLTSSMLQLCQDWSLALDRLPDKVASESIKSFQVVMHKLVELQSEEVKHRKRVDILSKEVERKASYFTGSKGKKQKTKMMMMMQMQKQDQEQEDQQAASSNPAAADSTDKQQEQEQQQEDDFYMNIPSILKNSTKRKEHASSSRFFAAETRLNALNSLRAKLEEEKEKVSKVVFDTRAMSINSLHTGLPSIFQAVAGFGRICSHAYQSLYCQAHNGAILRITEG